MIFSSPASLRFRKMRRSMARLTAFLLIVGCCASAVQAQTYTLGPDDVISVNVLRHAELSVDAQVVPSSGRIQVPAVGDVYVGGKTTSQVAAEITRRLKATLLRPEVTVALRAQRIQKVFVLGVAVGKTGVYDVKPGFRITEVMAMAGGLLSQPDQVSATLSRGGAKPIPLNLTEILTDGASRANLVLRNGDVLQFAPRVVYINIAGQVGRAGPVQVPVGQGIVQALSLAGGATPAAALSRVVVRRKGAEMPVDLYKAIVRGQGEDTFKLQNGDLIIVPRAEDRVSVLGAVQKPNYYSISDGMTMRVSDALAQAGGGTPRAALTRAVIRRADGSQTPVDLYKIVVQGSQEGNVALTDGDSIIVPEAQGVTLIGAIARSGTLYIEEARKPRLADVLAEAGGLSVKPEQAHISVTRRVPTVGSKPYTMEIDPVALLLQNSWSQNAEIQDGDVITVSGIQGQTVFVAGEVRNPGGFELREGDGLQELLSRAGGPTLAASLRQITITHRDGKLQMVDALDAIRKGKASEIKLQDGDYVIVPQNTNRVLVMAAVKSPGAYPLPEDQPLTVGEALALAGGPLETAKLKEVAILHQTPQGMQRRILPLKSARDVQANSNVKLQAGDILYVPQGSQSMSAWDVITRGVGLIRLFGF